MSCETQLCTAIYKWAKTLIIRSRQPYSFWISSRHSIPSRMNYSKSKIEWNMRNNMEMGRLFLLLSKTKSSGKWIEIRVVICQVWSTSGYRTWSNTVILFNLHINDILNDIVSEIRMFADDCMCYRTY